jgi:hypothetical protein
MPSLMDQVEKLPDALGRDDGWEILLEFKKPGLSQEINQLVDQWLRGEKTVRRKFPSRAKLAEFLGVILVEAGAPRSKTTLAKFIKERGESKDG